jgi:hypothetical protein
MMIMEEGEQLWKEQRLGLRRRTGMHQLAPLAGLSGLGEATGLFVFPTASALTI